MGTCMSWRKLLWLILPGIFLIAAGLYWNSRQIDDSQVARSIVYKLVRELEQIDAEAKRIINGSTDAWSRTTHSFYLLDSAGIVAWSKNDFLPDRSQLDAEFSLRLLEVPRGTFLVKKYTLDDNRYLVALLTLKDRYKINNRYLVSGWNSTLFSTQDIALADTFSPGYVFAWEGQPIFKLQVTATPVSRGFGMELLPVVVGLILIGWAFYLVVAQRHRQRQYGQALLLLIVFSLATRAFMLTYLVPIDLPLFDPAHYASSAFNRSVGDLFLNNLLLSLCVAYVFFNYHRFSMVRWILSVRGWVRPIVLVCLNVVAYFSLLFPFLFFESIFHNSQISLDITQSLAHEPVRLFSFLSVALGSFSGFMVCHLTLRLALGLSAGKPYLFYISLLAGAVLFALYAWVIDRDYTITLVAGTVFFAILRWWMLPKTLMRTSFITFLYLFTAIAAYALQGAFAISRFTVEDRVNAQGRFAKAFLTDRDYLGEYLLDESAKRIAADPFIQTRLGSPFLSKAVVRQKVRQVYLNSYFDRYEIQIHLFGLGGAPYDNTTSLSLSQWMEVFQTETNKTNYEGVFLLKDSSDGFTRRYLVAVPISRFSGMAGFIVMDLSLKRVIPRNVFPELLLDDQFTQYYKNRNFSYAFYANGRVSNSFGDYNYEMDFPVSLLTKDHLYEDHLIYENHIHIGIEDELGNTVVVSAPSYPVFNLVTNFSFLFTFGVSLILLALMFYSASAIWQRRHLNYAARIQLYVYLAFILPLVLVSATTLGLIGRSVETQLNREYLEKSKLLGERISPLIAGTHPAEPEWRVEFENEVIGLAKLVDVDATVFSPAGVLIASSQPLIYEDRIVSPLMNKKAYQAIVENRGQSFINSEMTGLLKHNTAYSTLKSPESGSLVGVLGLPFFESAYLLEKTQINVLSNILIVFCTVFILFSVVSFFAVRWLVFPLQFITRAIRRTTFTGSNSPVVWNSNDEIGLMVSEYNRMVENLELSKIELSRIQKETAWREIAKQVAHEIKNPLTPMKLILQQMEQGLAAGKLPQEKMSSAVQTLLTQVGILNNIASSFSTFARMPAPILTKIEITTLIKKVVDLHKDHPLGNIELTVPTAPLYILGDEQLLSRVFSNIILNSLQAGAEGQKVHIRITVSTTASVCQVCFADNGKGIDADLAEKIFMPHFSTKKSGSGLGLAIVKQGMEQHGGSIRFETQAGKGTVFYMEFPRYTGRA